MYRCSLEGFTKVRGHLNLMQRSHMIGCLFSGDQYGWVHIYDLQKNCMRLQIDVLLQPVNALIVNENTFWSIILIPNKMFYFFHHFDHEISFFQYYKYGSMKDAFRMLLLSHHDYSIEYFLKKSSKIVQLEHIFDGIRKMNNYSIARMRWPL